jgi:hypothetical protein
MKEIMAQRRSAASYSTRDLVRPRTAYRIRRPTALLHQERENDTANNSLNPEHATD